MLCRSFWQYVLIFLIPMTGSAQGVAPVRWDFKVLSTDPLATSISLRAILSPGWRLYSQFNSAEGPTPAKITFTSSDRYRLEGSTEEDGTMVTVYSEDYEMDVRWYEGQVVFHQEIKLETNDAMVKGNIEYMICNDQVCIPERQSFCLTVKP